MHISPDVEWISDHIRYEHQSGHDFSKPYSPMIQIRFVVSTNLATRHHWANMELQTLVISKGRDAIENEETSDVAPLSWYLTKPRWGTDDPYEDLQMIFTYLSVWRLALQQRRKKSANLELISFLSGKCVIYEFSFLPVVGVRSGGSVRCTPSPGNVWQSLLSSGGSGRFTAAPDNALTIADKSGGSKNFIELLTTLIITARL